MLDKAICIFEYMRSWWFVLALVVGAGGQLVMELLLNEYFITSTSSHWSEKNIRMQRSSYLEWKNLHCLQTSCCWKIFLSERPITSIIFFIKLSLLSSLYFVPLLLPMHVLIRAITHRKSSWLWSARWLLQPFHFLRKSFWNNVKFGRNFWHRLMFAVLFRLFCHILKEISQNSHSIRDNNR